jgi:subtilisin family serine protease
MPSKLPVLALVAALAITGQARASTRPPARDPGPVGGGAGSGPVGAVAATMSDEVKTATGTGDYIVLLAGEPLASYRGGLPGLAGTSPLATESNRLDPDSAASTRYLAHLTAVQDAFLAAAQGSLGHPLDVRFRYHYASNGVSVHLTADEARRIARLPGVTRVEANTPRHVTTDAGPTWIGAARVWDGSALGREVGSYGEGVVVGIIDTGINIDHPSFAEVDERGYEHANARGKYYGMCDRESPQYDRKFKCNDKLIGLYSFLTVPSNNMNPEDDNGHGSHTASTTAGNFVTTGYGASTTDLAGTFSGVAPHANIIAYDACYTASDGRGTCPPDATLAALDQAVADQVDVVNYSIETGQGSPWQDSHMLAFKRLREAGVIAAVSAGNAGPTEATTNAVAPWVMAVAATTHNRFFANELTGFAGGEGEVPAAMSGGGLTSAFGPAAIVYAKGHQNQDGTEDDGRCLKPFPKGEFTGQIVVCDRGQNGRTEKGTNVKAGGAGGMVLANTAADGDAINGDAHVLPAVHITFADAQALKGWMGKGSAHQAQITAGRFAPRAALADNMAGFSSRGPAVAERCCRRPGVTVAEPQLFPVLKPDVGAPGQEIIAAVSSGGGTPPEMASMSGTSMAGPHVAGAAALVRAVRPDWTPAEVQSALTSTAVQTGVHKENGVSVATPFDIGAGRVDVSRAVRAGLLLDITTAELDAANPGAGGDPSTLNLATLASVECLNRCRWQRVVRSALDRAVTWAVDADAPGNMPVSVSPADFTLAPGGTQVITVEADASALARDAWAFANLLLTPEDATVPVAHLTVAVRTVQAAIPPFAVITTTQPVSRQAIGGLRVSADTDISIDVFGLTKGDVKMLSMDEDPTPTNRWDVSRGGTEVLWLTVPDGARRVIAEISAAEASDVDLFLGYDTNDNKMPEQAEVVATSLSDGWHELAEVAGDGLRAGNYWVLVQNFTASKRAPDDITAVTGVVPDGEIGNLQATAPAQVSAGQPFDLDLSWQLPSLAPGDRWYGLVYVNSGPGAGGDLGQIPVDIIGGEERAATPTNPPATPATATTQPPPTAVTPATPTMTVPVPTPAETVEPSPTPEPGDPSPTPDEAVWVNRIFLPATHS